MRLAWTWRLSSHQQLLKWACHSLPSFKRACLCSTLLLAAQVDEDSEVLPAGFFDDLEPDEEVSGSNEKRGGAPGLPHRQLGSLASVRPCLLGGLARKPARLRRLLSAGGCRSSASILRCLASIVTVLSSFNPAGL